MYGDFNEMEEVREWTEEMARNQSLQESGEVPKCPFCNAPTYENEVGTWCSGNGCNSHLASRQPVGGGFGTIDLSDGPPIASGSSRFDCGDLVDTKYLEGSDDAATAFLLRVAAVLGGLIGTVMAIWAGYAVFQWLRGMI